MRFHSELIRKFKNREIILLTILLLISTSSHGENESILQSWNNTVNKNNIITFVSNTIDPSKASFVPEHERIAVFDMDGTILVEKPFYTQVLTSIHILKNKLKEDPALKSEQPYKAIIESDDKYIHSHGGYIIKKASENIEIRELNNVVKSHMKNNYHSKLNRKYKDLFYAPMLELIQFLVDNNFSVYIVSTSQQEFIRSYSNECLRLPKSNIIGSMMSFTITGLQENIKFNLSGNWWKPKNSALGKLLRIRERTGYIPIFAVGNSRGDKEMLIAASTIKGFVMLIDHDDADREYYYPKKDMLKLASKNQWNIVSMKHDFKEIYSDKCSL